MIRSRLLSATLLLAILLVPARSAFALEADHFTSSASQESLVSEMVVHPSALRDGSVTYIAWQGPSFDILVASYDEATDEWSGPYTVTTGRLRLDAHGGPSLFLDSRGYLHVLSGAHWSPIVHAVSSAPHSIRGAWFERAPIAMVATYPQTLRLSDGRIAVFFRQSSGVTGWSYRISADDGLTWGPVTALLYAPPGGTNWYLHAEAGSNGTILCAFLRREGGAEVEWYGRHDVFYAWRDSLGVWRNDRGEELTLPLTPENAWGQTLVYATGADVANELVVREEPSLGGSGAPRPMIQFLTGAGRGEGAYTWKLVRWTGEAWTASDITSADHGFDSGTFRPNADGSIDSWVVSGSDPTLTARSDPFEGRGGTIAHWRSEDSGATWSHVATVSPDETGTVFGSPQLVKDGSARARLVFTEWTNDRTAAFHRLYLHGEDGFVKRGVQPAVSRVSGDDRVRTAMAISAEGFPSGADTVVLATSRDYPDALAGAPLAHALRGPLLLVPGSITRELAAEIVRLQAKRAVILGSTNVLPVELTQQLRAAGITNVERVSGADRYATSLAIADRLAKVYGPLPRAVVASGRNFPDALAAAPFAAWSGAPIVLASPGPLPPATRDRLASLGVTTTIVVGGPTAVSSEYASALPSPTRLAGNDRYETAEVIAEWSLRNGLLPTRVFVASGTQFPDALAGAVLAARARGPMLLTAADALPLPTARALRSIAPATERAFLLGGTPAVGEGVGDELRAALAAVRER